MLGRVSFLTSSFFFLLALHSGCGPADDPDMKSKGSGLKFKDVDEGKGAEVKNGDVVVVHYTGSLRSGKVFDSSPPDKPFIFKIGAGKVIKGWDEGLLGMKAGGRRKLIIPSELGYGSRGSGSAIPPNSELRFDIELIEITTPEPKPAKKDETEKDK